MSACEALEVLPYLIPVRKKRVLSLLTSCIILKKYVGFSSIALILFNFYPFSAGFS